VSGVRLGMAALAVALAILDPAAAPAQIYAPQSIARDFKVEWQATRDRKGSAVEGYLYNTSRQTAQRVRLEIARLDAGGNLVGTSAIWLPGEVLKGDRAYFKAAVPDAPAYRVEVLSFDWSCEGGGGM
jgi:hypothetical protein